MTKLTLTVAALMSCVSFIFSSANAQPSALLALNTPFFNKSALEAISRTDESEKIIHFCGESIPTDQAEISERWGQTLDRRVKFINDLADMKRRATVIFPLIEPILKQYGIPEDFKYLPLIESGVSSRAVSRMGAAGFWQLMPGTGKSLGLKVYGKGDERFDLMKSTHAACRYINELHDQLGSWMLTATAYNAGPNYIQQIARQYPNRHPMTLPYRASETKAYLYNTVAIKELLTRPQAYGNWLNDRQMVSLSDDVVTPTAAEREAILASFDFSEADRLKIMAGQPIGDQVALFQADSATSELYVETESTTAVPVPDAPTRTESVADKLEKERITNQLITRCLTTGPLTEGKLYIFQVVQPITLHGRTFAVGDIIQAHVDLIDDKSKRVFLRTDRLIKAETQETIALGLVATEAYKQAGVSVPTRMDGWQLSWEAL